MSTNCKDPITETCDIPPPESFRRGLVFGTSFSLLLISIISAKNIWDYLIIDPSSIYDVALLIFSGAGISYAVFLWFSFLLMGIKKLPGCGWTAIDVGLFNRKWHVCVDSVLNAKQDKVQQKSGISVELLKTDGFKLWGGGLLGFIVIAYILTLDFIPLEFRLIILGVISSLYYIEDITIHEFSKYDGKLTGKGDYQKLLKQYLHGPRIDFKYLK